MFGQVGILDLFDITGVNIQPIVALNNEQFSSRMSQNVHYVCLKHYKLGTIQTPS